MAPTVFYVGTAAEVAHHAQPLKEVAEETGKFRLEIIEPREVVAKATANDLAIFFSEHFERFRTAVIQLNAKGCRTLYAIDGILEWRNAFENRGSEPACPWTMRPVLSHKVAAIGRSQARLLDFWGNKDKVELVGLPRFDRLVVENNFQKPGNESAQPNSTKDEKASPKKLMVMTAKWPAFTDEQEEIVQKSLISIKRFLDTRQDIEVIWRLTGGLEAQLKIENSMGSCNKGELVEQLTSCDALITTPSTAMLEGVLMGKPTAILEFNDCPQLTGSAWQIRHEDQIPATVDELLCPPESKMALQEFWLHDSLECRTPALTRLVHLVESMLKYDAANIPAGLVEMDSPHTMGPLGKDFLYNNHRLFESDELTELQTQLAFMQREVQRLQERNDLVEGEFEKAKSTIDNVFNNPVVSPFIKAGEYAGKLFAKKKTNSTE